MRNFLMAIGYTSKLDEKNRFAYIIAAIGLTQLMIFLPFYFYVLQSLCLTFETILVTFVYLWSFYCLKKKMYLTGKILITMGIAIQVFMLVMIWFPAETSFAYYYFIIPPISFFILDIDIIKERWYLIGINGLVAAFVIIGATVEPLELIVLSEPHITLLKMMSISMSILSEVVVFYSYAYNLSKTHRSLRLLADTDALTRVGNRRILFEKGNLMFDLERKYNRHFSLMILDIDYFKRVNDAYGHPVGDLVLMEITEVIKASIRGEDTLCRYGGEEFGILFMNLNSKQFHIMEKIKENISNHTFLVDDKEIHLTVSAGVVSTDKAFDSFGHMVRTADSLLYEAKRSGRNKIVYHYG